MLLSSIRRWIFFLESVWETLVPKTQWSERWKEFDFDWRKLGSFVLDDRNVFSSETSPWISSTFSLVFYLLQLEKVERPCSGHSPQRTGLTRAFVFLFSSGSLEKAWRQEEAVVE